MKKIRNRYAPNCRAEALRPVDRTGVSAAVRKLKLQASQLYPWRTKTQQKANTSDCEQVVTDENARLKRQLAEKVEDEQYEGKA